MCKMAERKVKFGSKVFRHSMTRQQRIAGNSIATDIPSLRFDGTGATKELAEKYIPRCWWEMDSSFEHFHHHRSGAYASHSYACSLPKRSDDVKKLEKSKAAATIDLCCQIRNGGARTTSQPAKKPTTEREKVKEQMLSAGNFHSALTEEPLSIVVRSQKPLS